MKKRKQNWKHKLASYAGVSVMAVTGLSGMYFIGSSLAATTNPYGFADSCALEGGSTVIYGWAADAQAKALSNPSVIVKIGDTIATVATDQTNYRKATIDKYIDQNYPGDPKPGTYGFKAVFNGLYKGSGYVISGTLLNEGAGSNVPLGVNRYGNVDSDKSKPYFVSNTLPDACLANRPATPPPPAPAPLPTPIPVVKPSPAPMPTIPFTPTAAPAPSSDANGGTVAGSLAAQITVPAGNASKVHLLYGTDPANLDQSSPDQDTGGADSVVLLTGLQASKAYAYKIVRSNDSGQSATSEAMSFTTANFILNIHFTNNQSKAIAGVPASLKGLDKSGSSGKDGVTSFSDVPAGNYQVEYSYLGNRHSLDVAADSSSVSDDAASKPAAASLDYFINVDKVSVTKKTVSKPTSASKLPVWLLPLLLLVVAATVVLVLAVRRRRQAASPDGYDFGEPSAAPYDEFVAADPEVVVPANNQPAPTQPQAVPPVSPPPVVPPASPDAPPSAEASDAAVGADGHNRRHHAPKVVQPLPDDSPEHMGESLKEMVLRSMAQAERQKHQASHPPVAPVAPASPPETPVNPAADPRNPGTANHHYPWR